MSKFVSDTCWLSLGRQVLRRSENDGWRKGDLREERGGGWRDADSMVGVGGREEGMKV